MIFRISYKSRNKESNNFECCNSNMNTVRHNNQDNQLLCNNFELNNIAQEVILNFRSQDVCKGTA